MKKFPVLASEFVMDEPYCRIERQQVQFPDGTDGTWYIKHSADAVIVIPRTASGEIILQRSYKHGGGKIVTEFCAGLVDSGETPEVAAARELTEETGYKTEKLRFLGKLLANPTGSPMWYHLFVAENVKKSADFLASDEAEQIEPFVVANWETAVNLLRDPATITSAATLAAVGMYRED